MLGEEDDYEVSIPSIEHVKCRITGVYCVGQLGNVKSAGP